MHNRSCLALVQNIYAYILNATMGEGGHFSFLAGTTAAEVIITIVGSSGYSVVC